MRDPTSDRMGCDFAVQQLILRCSASFSRGGRALRSSNRLFSVGVILAGQILA
jgi:hypothetical protein